MVEGARVLITGGTGFIGSHLARTLTRDGGAEGHRLSVHIMDRSERTLWRIRDISEQVTVHHVDIQDAQALTSLVREITPTHVVHLAGALDHRRDFALLQELIAANLVGTLNLMDALRPLPVRRIVNIGTCEEYGTGPAPFHEDQREIPVSPYSFSKTCATYLASLCSGIFEMPVMTVRPFLCYGEGQSPTLLIPQVIVSCLQDKEMKFTEGRQTREVNYVGDIARGLKEILFSASFTPGDVVNLGNSTPVEIRKLVKMIFGLIGRAAPPRFGDLPYRKGEAFAFYADTSKLQRQYHFRPAVSLQEGLTRTVAWYRENLGNLPELFAPALRKGEPE